MVLTPSRYLDWFRSYSYLNTDMSESLQTLNHDDVGRHDSTVHYIFCDDVCRHDNSKVVKDLNSCLVNTEKNQIQ